MVEEFFNNSSTMIVEKLFEHQPHCLNMNLGNYIKIPPHPEFCRGILGWISP